MVEQNEQELKVAFKVWSAAIAKQNDIANKILTSLQGSSDLVTSFRSGEVDLAIMSSREFFTLFPNPETIPIMVASTGKQIGEEYLLLVPKASPATRLGDLQGKKLELFEHHSMALAEEWLNSALAGQTLPEASRFFGKITKRSKTSGTVLPVFFHSSDACLVTRRGLETMVELNPQMGQKVRPLAASPRLIPMVLLLKPQLNALLRDKLTHALLEMHRSPQGRQILSVFQVDELKKVTLAQLETTRALIAPPGTPPISSP